MVPPDEFYPTARLTQPHWTTYALGWFQQDYNGRAVDFHTGSIDGMVAIIGLIPDERLGVYVLANADHVELRHALMLKAFDLWGPTPAEGSRLEHGAPHDVRRTCARRPLPPAKAAEAKRVTGTKPSLPLARYAGTYADSLYGEATVTTAGDGLRLKVGHARGHTRALAVRHVPREVGQSLARHGAASRSCSGPTELLRGSRWTAARLKEPIADADATGCT